MQELKKEQKYFKEGQAAGAVGAIITLIVGVGISVLVLIFVGTLGGQVYEIQEGKLNTIGLVYTVNSTGSSVLNETLTNRTIQNEVKASVVSGFSALKQTGDYLPIIVLAVIISLVLMLVLSFGGVGGMGSGGSAL